MPCSAATKKVLALLLVGTGGCAADAMGGELGSIDQPIIGGQDVAPGAYPATGALVRGRSYRCTATLIAPDVILTAAHCLDGDGWGDFGFTLDAELKVDITNVVPALIYHQHPNFQSEASEDFTRIGQRNDIGIVILEEPILDVPFEQLDTDEEYASLQTGDELLLCGYGRNSWSSQLTAGLKREATIYVDLATSWELQSVRENPQPCKGDSGGPVFIQTPNGRRITGLVSRAAGESRMCDTGAIYTRVSTYVDWIEDASQDRDQGCAAGGRGGAALWTWPALLAGLAIARRRKRRPLA